MARDVFGDPLPGRYLASCDNDGNYEKVQCHLSTCWCVDQFGQEMPNSRVNGRPNCDIVGKFTALMHCLPIISVDRK